MDSGVTRMLMVAVAGLCALPAPAQHWMFQSYGSQQGLLNSNIIALHQDRTGYLWVSTEGGLLRFDGDRFRHFEVRTGRRVSVVSCLHTSADGQLWAAGSAGLFRFDGRTFQPVPGFAGLDLDGRQTVTSDATTLYVATPKGLRAVPLSSGARFKLLSSHPSRSVYLGKDGGLLFGCGTSLCRWQDGRVDELKSDAIVKGGPWLVMIEDRAGRLWIRSKDNLLRRDEADGAFLPVKGLGAIRSALRAQLSMDRLGQVLVPHTAGLGVCGETGCRVYGPESGLRRAELYSVLEDRERSLWFGYSGQGLDRRLGREQWLAFSEMEGLDNPSIWRIIRSPDGALWVGTGRGLFRGVPEDGQWQFRRSSAVADSTVYGLAGSPDGTLWLGTFQTGLNGLLHYDPRNGKKTFYPPEQPVERFAVNQIRRDGSGTVWVCTRSGLMRLRPGRTRLEAYPMPSDPAPVYDIAKTARGLFVGTSRGLYVETDGLRRLFTMADGLKDDRIQSVVPAPDGSVWLAYLAPVGITRIKVEGSRLRLLHLGEAEGLSSNTVYLQAFDAGGRHWVGTGKGVVVYDQNRWVPYDVSDGLIWDDCNSNAVLAEPDGGVWIGTSGGLARFYARPKPALATPETIITAVLRNERPAQGTTFDSETRSVTVRFSMLSFERQNVLFRYRLGGGKRPWTETRAREVKFAELPDGRHDFEVQGQAESGEWGRAGVVSFRIQPTWYRFWPNQLAMVALCCGWVWWWWRRREARQRNIRACLEEAVEIRTRELAKAHDELELRVEDRTRELQEEIERRESVQRDLFQAKQAAEESSRAKTTFLSNMSHELRTPLNVIIGYSEMLQEEAEASGTEGRAQDLCRIRDAGRHLLEIVEDVLDFTRSEYGPVEVRLEPQRVSDFTIDAARAAEEMARTRGNRFTCEAGCPDDYFLADSGKFRRSLFNLLSNACKFTDHGEVRLGISRRETEGRTWICWEVEDTGIGIAGENIPKLFQSFSQVDSSSTRRHDGTGLGLAISQRLCRIMGGHITVESEAGQGSRFTIHMPACDISDRVD
jgi:signal transduction histidine kinase/ligand-binding sensor domain-containing protein